MATTIVGTWPKTVDWRRRTASVADRNIALPSTAYLRKKTRLVILPFFTAYDQVTTHSTLADSEISSVALIPDHPNGQEIWISYGSL